MSSTILAGSFEEASAHGEPGTALGVCSFSARCPVFAEIGIDEAAAQVHLPVQGVPPGVLQGAVQMQSIEHSAPNLSCPASRQMPFSNTAEAQEGEADAVELGEEKEDKEDNSGCFRALDAVVAKENANAEYLIGLEDIARGLLRCAAGCISCETSCAG